MPYKRHLQKQHRQRSYWLLKTRLSSYWLGIFRYLGISEAYFDLKIPRKLEKVCKIICI